MTTNHSAAITPAELDWARAARVAHPEMTSYGFLPSSLYGHSWETELSLVDLQQVAVSRRWLEACTPWLKRATKDCIGSYGAKHCVENWSRAQGTGVTYVKEGALLLAAVTLDVPLLRYRAPSWGAYLGLSKRALAAIAPAPVNPGVAIP